ncbi:hypothetical protein [Novacetimonas hansenii]|nr:hypothetical protein [Novacetimonas hansenii]
MRNLARRVGLRSQSLYTRLCLIRSTDI